MSNSSTNRILTGIVIAAAVILLGAALFIDLGNGFPVGSGTRTVMMYGIGSNLESAHGNLSFTIGQMLDSDIKSNVKIVIMTGGSYRWFLPEDRTVDSSGNPVQGDPSVKQLWEIRKDDSGDNKLVLVENMESLNDNYMTDEISLQTFLTYCKKNYPSDVYDLILWDHGYGPFGYGDDSNCIIQDSEYDEIPMPLEQVADAIKKADFGGKLEMINFDACLMSCIEAVNVLSDYADYMVVSAESVPEFGEYYTNWISKVSENPGMNGFEIGKMIVDDTIAYYSDESSKGYGRPCTFAVIDTAEYNAKMLDPLLDFTSKLAADALKSNVQNTYYNKFVAAAEAHKYSWEGITDILDMASKLSVYEDTYSEDVSSLSSVLSDSSVIYFAHTASVQDSCGLSFFFPGNDPQNTKRYVVAMEALKAYIGESVDDIANVKAAILDNQITMTTSYGLVRSTGYAVSELVDKNKANITYGDLADIWNTRETLSVKKIEFAHERGYAPDENGLSTPWDKGISVLMDRAGKIMAGRMTAEEWVAALASNIENEIRQGTDCALPSNGLAGEIAIRSARNYTDIETMEKKTEPYDAVIGNIYGRDESEITPFDGRWYALTDAEGHNYLTSLITTTADPSAGTSTVIIKKTETSYDGSPYELELQGAITVSLADGSPRITGIYLVDSGEYVKITAEEAENMSIYTGYLTRGYSANILSPGSVLALDTSAENFGLSITPGIKLEDMDDVDFSRACTAQLTYTYANIYGYVRKVG
ncbi:MAG: hypothetical protein K6A80_07050 [Saccharofermentans sp.]|nr:hypothetical protein [Saccharofermentans sp.]